MFGMCKYYQFQCKHTFHDTPLFPQVQFSVPSRPCVVVLLKVSCTGGCQTVDLHFITLIFGHGSQIPQGLGSSSQANWAILFSIMSNIVMICRVGQSVNRELISKREQAYIDWVIVQVIFSSPPLFLLHQTAFIYQ